MSDYDLTEATVVGATYNDVAVETPTIADGVLSVDLSGETVNTNGVLVVELDNNKEVVDLILKDLVFEQKHMNLE